MDARPMRGARVGIDATSWVSRRGFGRFMRNSVGRLVQTAPANEYVFFIDEVSAGGANLPAGVDVRRIPVSRAPTQAAAAGSSRGVGDLFRMSRAVRRERLDAFLFPSLYTWFPVFGVPTIVGVHDTMIEQLPELTVPVARERLAVTAKHQLGIRLARTLFTVSEYSRRAIAAHFGIPQSRLHLVPEAPDPVFARKSGAALAAGLRAAGLAPDDRFFLFFGGISPHKNIETLIDAYASLLREGTGGVPLLVLVGEMEGSAYLSAARSVRDRIARHDLGASVRLPGFVSDETLACLCSAATAVVLPSLAEGFGLPAVEAAACGAPLALSELDAHRETMGDAALYFAPMDVRGLAGLLARLACDEALRHDLAARASAAVKGRTWDAAARALAQIVSITVCPHDGRGTAR